MIKEILNFKHESESIPSALGLSETIDNKCREIIHFASFTNYFIKNDFFEDEMKLHLILQLLQVFLKKH